MGKEKYDLVVIGAGPGGYVAAIRAKQLGLNVAVIEANHLGGICLNWGCIPTKALLKTSEKFYAMKHAEEFGLKVENYDFDLKKVISRSRDVAGKLSSGISHLLKKNKITLIEGFAKFKSSNIIEIFKGDEKLKKIEAKNTIIASGARAKQIPNLEADGKLIWNYKEAMTPDKFPKKLLVVGSGAIGIEFASFYNAMGSNVTVIEMMDRVLPVEDKEISQLAHKQFEKHGIKIHVKAGLKKFAKQKDSVKASFEINGKINEEEFDRVIMAVGITGNTENMNLEKFKIKIEKGFIVTGDYLETGEKNIYAIGDITNPPWLAHKASHEAIICVEKIAGLNPKPLKLDNIPGCTYSMPQIASIGITEEKAKEDKIKVKIGRFPFLANGKAIASNSGDGLIKVIFDDKTGELLGAHMVGENVTELVQGFAIAKTAELTEAELMHTIFPHPTLSEMMHEATLDAYGRAIHI